MNKGAGRQNGRNDNLGTEGRKRNEKKWGQSKRSLGQHYVHQHLHYKHPRRKREIERAQENI